MCSVSRARADSSPLPQAFNRFVISAGRAWMDGPFFKKYTRNVAGFGRRLPTVPVEESKPLPKTGGTNERSFHEAHTFSLSSCPCIFLDRPNDVRPGQSSETSVSCTVLLQHQQPDLYTRRL